MVRLTLPVGVVLLVALAFGQTYNLSWGAFTNGGTEFPNARWGGPYKLADNVGRGTSETDTILTDLSSYVLYPGYRFVELDLRYPTSWIDSMDTITHSPSFVVSWGGVDTTIEDGEGWGIRYYDVQYAVNDSTVWYDWYTGVSFTSAVFGPTSPVVVREDTTYYFRVKAYDLATNEEPDHPSYDQKTKYVPAAISFMVYNPNSGLPIWSADTADPGQTVSMDSADVLVIKNLGDDTLTLALRGFPVAEDTAHHNPVWTLADFAGKDTFALRAHFSDDPRPPLTYTSTDAVRDTFIFADAGYYGGPTHGVLYSYSSGDSTAFSENLWLQVLLPTSVSVYGDTTVYQFTVQLKARRRTP